MEREEGERERERGGGEGEEREGERDDLHTSYIQVSCPYSSVHVHLQFVCTCTILI